MSRLGLKYGTVRIAESDPTWPAEFERLAADVRRALGDDAGAVEHIGSTAVPGLPAKPIIDIAVRLTGDAETGRTVEKLEGLGYIYRGDTGSQGGLLFVLETEPLRRIAHVHVLHEGDDQWERYLAFRDRLRSDPQARVEFGRLKYELAERFPNDRRAYTDAKNEFVARVLGRA